MGGPASTLRNLPNPFPASRVRTLVSRVLAGAVIVFHDGHPGGGGDAGSVGLHFPDDRGRGRPWTSSVSVSSLSRPFVNRSLALWPRGGSCSCIWIRVLLDV